MEGLGAILGQFESASEPKIARQLQENRHSPGERPQAHAFDVRGFQGSDVGSGLFLEVAQRRSRGRLEDTMREAAGLDY